MRGSVIDVRISPQQATISALLSHVRKALSSAFSSLRRGVAEAIEAVARTMKALPAWLAASLTKIKLPPGTIISAVVRGNDNVIA